MSTKQKPVHLRHCPVCELSALAEAILHFERITFIHLPWSPGERAVPFHGDPESLPITRHFDAVRARYPDAICRHGVRVMIRGVEEVCRQIIAGVAEDARATGADPETIRKAESYALMNAPPQSVHGRIIRVRAKS